MDERLADRSRLIAEIEMEVRETEDFLGKDKLDPRVIEAMTQVPREDFVPDEAVDAAYVNAPLKIGQGQTISQPYIVAIMTDMLNPEPGHKVLEIGTGSGYQAAVLSRLVSRVYSVEVIPELAKRAAERLARLGYANVEVREADGRDGWPEHAPYDGIIVTAAARRVPPALLQQLKPGGRMTIPIGGQWLTQQLMLIEKDEAGKIRKRPMLPVAFVPLTRGR